jgi:hypothetical protein
LIRSPRRRRPRKDDRLALDAGIDLGGVAEKATYIISAEHKDYLTSAGPGKLRSDASACPRGMDFDDVERRLKAAINACHVSAAFEGDFPRYVWAAIDGRYYEARLSNAGLGTYKGYPIFDYEAPGWLS